MIELAGVTKEFTTGQRTVVALDSVSLKIEKGEFVAVRGHSGCGKSTLLSLVGGLAVPTSGSVSVGGEVISEMSASLRAFYRASKIGFVFQMFHLLPYLNVRDNVLVAATDSQSDDVRAQADKLLKRFQLQDRYEHLPGQLSTGERQRVAMARAMLNQPTVLLADEPTGNLDKENATEVLGLLEDFHKDGGTVLLVTHDEFAAGHASRSIELDAGKLVTG